jgi:RHS repeat-associated protein
MYQLATSGGGFGTVVNSGISNTGYSSALAIDYDQDGRDDFLVPYSGTTWWVVRGSDTGLLPPVDTGTIRNGGNTITLDVNGDARDDLLWTSPNEIYANYRNAGSAGFSSTATLLFTSSGGLFFCSCQDGRARRRALDVNGDGIRDVAFVRLIPTLPWGPTTYVGTALLGGGQGVWDIVATTAYVTIRTGDFNGDGYFDFAYVNSTGSLVYRISTGRSLATAVTAGTVNASDFDKSVVRDWDSDGYDDILVPQSSNSTWYVYLSNGSGLQAGVSTGVATGSPSYSVPMDLNADGLDDFGAIKSNGQFVAWIRNGPAPDLMNSIVDGYNNTIATTYTSISQGSYTPGSGATFPNVNFRGPIIVPSAVDFSDGVGTTYRKTYEYSDAQIGIQSDWQTGLSGSSVTATPNPAPSRGLRPSLQDAGNVNQTQFKGFGSIKVTDDRNNLVTITTYDQRALPYTGMITAQGIYQPGGTQPIRTAAITTDSVSGGTGFDTYALPYVAQSASSEYEVGGTYNAQLKRTTTTTVAAIDSYGTITDTTTQVAEPATGANGVQPGETYTTRTLLSSVTNNTGNWCLGKPGSIEVRGSHSPSYGGGMISRTRTQVWNTATYCRLDSEVIQPGAAQALSRSLLYDGFGNLRQETLSGLMNATEYEDRVTRIEYVAGASEPGRLPVTVTNAEGEITTLSWDWAKGLETSRTDPNGVAVSWQYDAFGRMTRETRAVDSTATSRAYNDCAAVSGGCLNSNNRMTVVETELDSAGGTINDTRIYLDAFDRVLSTSRRLLDGSYDRNDRQYNDKLELYRTSAPCRWSSCTPYWTTFSRDLIGRVTVIERPISESNPAPQSTLVYYQGLRTRVVDAEGKDRWRVENATGELARTIDHAGYYQNFAYDGFGSLLQVSDSQGNTLLSATYAYGAAAFRTQSSDMDMGTWDYSPNAFGDTYAWTDMKGQSFSATFDELSRPRTRLEPEGLSEWIWGSSPSSKNVGQLIETRNPSYQEQYQYQASGGIGAGRQTGITFTAESVAYQVDLEYHATQGFLEKVTYPQSTGSCRVKVQYGYQNGYLRSLTDSSSAGACGSTGTVYWQANAVNARNQVQSESLGSNIATSRTFDAVTGELRAVSSVNGGTSLQNLGFLYDKVGSLTQRQDNRLGLTEDLYYDDLHRLQSSVVGATTVSYGYDPLGNLTQKTDLGFGQWTYHATRRHQLLSAAGGLVSYTYDANGNAITRSGQSITWTSYNYPSRVNQSGGVYDEFAYGPNRERWKHVYAGPSGTETTLRLGRFLEKVATAAGTDWRHYLFAGEQTVAVYSRTSAGANTVRYVLEDHQGGIAALATSGGSLAVNESFTPFGQRRSGSSWQLPISGGDQTTINGISRRGYTGHNHLGGAPLIHMNGRMQDPLTGRFLSADPYVANPASTQGWNRYSYVENDPASYTDPSGFVRSCGIGFVAVSMPTFGYSYGGGGADGYGGGGFWFGFETIWMPVISCADIPESAVLPRTDLDTPRYNPLTALTSSEVWKSFLASWQENLDRTGAELSKDPEALLGQAVASIGGPAKVVLGAAGRIAAAARGGVSVLGHASDGYVSVAKTIGARHFNVPTKFWEAMSPAEQWAANTRFLDRLIARGDTAVLATQASAARAGSFFARELEYLSARGYTLSSDGLRMLPPVP